MRVVLTLVVGLLGNLVIGGCYSRTAKPDSVQKKVQSRFLKPMTQRPLAKEEVDTPAKRIKGDDPRYPVEARSKEMKGYVKVRLTIDSEGTVRMIDVLEENPPFPEFLSAVRKAVGQWRYEPAMLKGQPVPSVVVMKFAYENRHAVGRPRD